MAKSSKEDFRFTDNQMSPNKLYQDEANEIRLEKLGNRVTLISILLPLLIIAVLAVAYLDITRKVTTVEYTGTSEVETLSKSLQSNFSSLSLKFAALEEKFNKRLDGMDEAQQKLAKKVHSTESVLWRTHADLRKLEHTAVSRDDLDKATGKFSETVAALQNNMQVLNQNLSALDASVKKELASAADAISKSGASLDALSRRVDSLSKEKADQDSLADMLFTLDKQNKTTRKTLQDSIDDMNRRVEELNHRLEGLEKHLHPHAASVSKTPAKPKAPTKAKPTPTPPAKPKAKSGTATTSNQIIEQSIQ